MKRQQRVKKIILNGLKTAKMGKIGIDKSIGIKTRFPHNDATKGGRPISIKAQLKDLLESEGNLTIPAKQIISINDDGSVVMKVPTQMQLAMKLQSWAMSKKGGDSLKAIQMIMEQVDGKPKQEVESTINAVQPLTFTILKNKE